MNVLWPRPCERWLQKAANIKGTKQSHTEQGVVTVLMYGAHTLINLCGSDASERHQGTLWPQPLQYPVYASSFYFLNVRIRSLTHP
jgi:hypothetical protein